MQRGLVLILVGVTIVDVGTLGRHIDRISNRASSVVGHRRTASAETVDVTASGTTCSACGAAEDRLDAEERRRLMIELAKIKLLKKLNLTEAPLFDRSHVTPLPAPILAAFNRDMHKDEIHTPRRHKPEDAHGATVEKVVLVGEEEFYPDDLYLSRSRHFGFRLRDSLFQYDVRSAAFWIAPIVDGVNETTRCTLYVSDTQGIYRTTSELPGVSGRILGKGRLRKDIGEWMRFDVTETIRKWLRHGQSGRRLSVTCVGCPRRSEPQQSVPIRTDNEYKPFVEINTRKKVQRKRRSIDNARVNGGCYLEHLYVNFTEIGWHTWIKQPPGYNAKYCRGTCVHYNSLTTYSGIVREVIKSRPRNHTFESLVAPCCAAIETGSISIVYEVEANQYMYEKLDDMVADKCDCR